MSRAKGNRTIREKAKPYYEALGFKTDSVELGGRFVKEKDLFARIFEDDDETYSAKGFDIVAISEECLILIQVATNSPKTQKWYKRFAKKYANERLLVHVFTHYDGDGFRIQNYTPDGKIIETDLRKSKQPHAVNTFFWFLKDK